MAVTADAATLTVATTASENAGPAVIAPRGTINSPTTASPTGPAPASGTVTPLHGDAPEHYTSAVTEYLTSAGIAVSSRRVYRISLITWTWLAAGSQPPGARDRRHVPPPELRLAALDDPATARTLERAVARRAGLVDADTLNRELSVFRGTIGWWRHKGWLASDPTVGLRRRPAPPDRTRALSRALLADLWEIKAGLREKTLWHMLYDTCARVEELLPLNIEDLDQPNKRGRVVGKGGEIEWVHWQSPTAQLLPRLIAGRTRGPLFLTDRKAPARTPTLDVCPVTGRARLSYRRAAELFEEATRPLADPAHRAHGFTLHQLRHSAVTHESEDGTSTPMLLARSRHASVRSLERYAGPAWTPSPHTSPDAIPQPSAGNRPTDRPFCQRRHRRPAMRTADKIAARQSRTRKARVRPGTTP
ncbi:MAG TPA: site-specific integrase, partial [Pseudonocardiaceae bacterium]|nr:site-specific integrase [Pseudonocardiaceae bacterium]